MRARRLLAIGFGVAVLAGGGVALAAVGVDLTAAGPQPATVTVRWGRRSCSPTGTASPTRSRCRGRPSRAKPFRPEGRSSTSSTVGGVYIVRQLGSRVQQGRVVVEVDGTVTLTAKESIRYGKPLVVSGTSTVAGSAVSLVRAVPDDPGAWEELATAEVGEDGKFMLRLELEVGGRFRAEAAAGQIRSTPIRVDVQPKITLAASDRSVAVGQLVEITGKIAPGGAAKTALLEVYDAGRKRWQRERSARVDASGAVTFRHRFEEAGRITGCASRSSGRRSPPGSPRRRAGGSRSASASRPVRISTLPRGQACPQRRRLRSARRDRPATIDCFEAGQSRARRSCRGPRDRPGDRVRLREANPRYGVHLPLVRDDDKRSVSEPGRVRAGRRSGTIPPDEDVQPRRSCAGCQSPSSGRSPPRSSTCRGGDPITHVDSHRHVHKFPLVQDALAEAAGPQGIDGAKRAGHLPAPAR